MQTPAARLGKLAVGRLAVTRMRLAAHPRWGVVVVHLDCPVVERALAVPWSVQTQVVYSVIIAPVSKATVAVWQVVLRLFHQCILTVKKLQVAAVLLPMRRLLPPVKLVQSHGHYGCLKMLAGGSAGLGLQLVQASAASLAVKCARLWPLLPALSVCR